MFATLAKDVNQATLRMMLAVRRRFAALDVEACLLCAAGDVFLRGSPCLLQHDDCSIPLVCCPLRCRQATYCTNGVGNVG